MPTCAFGVFMMASAARARLPFAHSVIWLMSRLTLRPMIASIRATDSFTVSTSTWSASKDSSSGSCWLPGMEQLFDRLFRALDARAVLAIVLLGLKLLQETETRRSGRVPRSPVLGHAEPLLAAMRHLIATESRAAHFLHPGAATAAKASCGTPRIALIVKRREAKPVGLREQNAAVRRTEMRKATPGSEARSGRA